MKHLSWMIDHCCYIRASLCLFSQTRKRGDRKKLWIFQFDKDRQVKMAKNFAKILFVSMLLMMIWIRVECFGAGFHGNMYRTGTQKRDKM